MLQSLPATQRGAFTLCEVLGFSAAETAAVRDTTVPAAAADMTNLDSDPAA